MVEAKKTKRKITQKKCEKKDSKYKYKYSYIYIYSYFIKINF